jgi:hypothetical protein
MALYLFVDSAQRGPLSFLEIEQFLASGEVHARTPARTESMTEWRSLEEMHPELFVRAPAAQSAAVETAICAATGDRRRLSDMVQIDGQWVGLTHKDLYLQSLREGGKLGQKAGMIQSGVYQFKDPRGLALWTQILVILWAVTGSLVTWVVQFAPALSDAGVDPEMVEGIAALLFLPVLLACFTVFGIWIYRVVANAHALRGRWMQMKPGWAVGFYFVPFANLFKPFQPMSEIWSSFHAGQTVPGMMRFWWAMWLISNLLGNVMMRMDSIPFVLAVMESMVNVLLAWSACWLIRSITATEVEAARI